MAEPSRRIAQGLYRLHFHQIPPKPTSQKGVFSHIISTKQHLYSPSFENYIRSHSSAILPSKFSNSKNLISESHTQLCFREFSSKSKSSDGLFSQIVSSEHHSHISTVGNSPRNYSSEVFSSGFLNPGRLSQGINLKLQGFSSRSLGFSRLNGNSLRSRYISFWSSDASKLNGNFTKVMVDKPLSAVLSTVTRYREAVGLQIEAFLKRNYLVLAGIGGVAVCILLWRLMFGITNTFVGLSEGIAKYGFLALSAAIVALCGLYIHSRFAINPDSIYRMAMRKLNTSAGILEVMGAPLSGTDLRAYVMSGGGLRLKNFKLRFRSKRCFLIFPIRGSERKGLVSVEVNKKKGQHDMKLLAVDIPMKTGPDQRLFLIGDEEEYKIGGGLISELRDPVVKAMVAEKEFEDLDQKEEEEDAERERQEAERKNREDIGKLEKGSSV